MNTNTLKKMSGFSLIELVVAVLMIGILMSVAVPGYREYVLTAGRTDGTAALLDGAQKMEVFYAGNASYTTTLADVDIDADSKEEKFTIAISAATAGCPITSCYQITATAVGNQTDDDIQGFRIGSDGAEEWSNGSSWSTGWSGD